MGAMIRGLLLTLLCATAHAGDATPLPLRRSVILPSGGDYFVEGRQEIKWGQELSVQKETVIRGRGEVVIGCETREEVDQQLHRIMKSIHETCVQLTEYVNKKQDAMK